MSSSWNRVIAWGLNYTGNHAGPGSSAVTLEGDQGVSLVLDVLEVGRPVVSFKPVGVVHVLPGGGPPSFLRLFYSVVVFVAVGGIFPADITLGGDRALVAHDEVSAVGQNDLHFAPSSGIPSLVRSAAAAPVPDLEAGRITDIGLVPAYRQFSGRREVRRRLGFYPSLGRT